MAEKQAARPDSCRPGCPLCHPKGYSSFREVFAFTAVDIYTRENDVLFRPALEATNGRAFLEHCMPERYDGFSEIIQTDGGSEIKGEFSQVVDAYCDRHRVARPYKKNEQTFIESVPS